MNKATLAIYTKLDALPPAHRGAVLVIGNFDGVHIGHQQVIARARTAAQDCSAPLGVMMFEPHPRRFFASDAPPFRLTKLTTRQRLLAEHNVDFILALPFDAALAACTAEHFISDILCAKLAIRAVAVGHDFRFGHKRQGDVALLTHFAEIHGFDVLMTEAVMQPDGNAPYSSSAIRTHLRDGAVEQATALLGRAWGIEAAIEDGDKRGRTLDFPTINMALGDYLHPQFGVYAVRALLLDGTYAGQTFNGVANLGLRPTIGGDAPRLESHLFDFDGDLYGATAYVELLHFIRPEQKFDTLAALKAQIATDARYARDYFK